MSHKGITSNSVYLIRVLPQLIINFCMLFSHLNVSFRVVVVVVVVGSCTLRRFVAIFSAAILNFLDSVPSVTRKNHIKVSHN